MSKKIRIIIITALLLGFLLPAADYYYELEQRSFLENVEAQQKNEVKNNLSLAQEAFYKGNYKKAEAYYKRAIKLDPFNFVSRRNLAVIYNDQNKLFAKNEILLELAILSGKNYDYLNLALNFYELNNIQASNFILSNKVEPDLENKYLSFQYYYYLIKNNLEIKNYNLAEKYIREIEKLEINKAEVYLLQAELNKKEKTLSRLIKIIKAHIKNREVKVIYSRIWLKC